MVIGTWIMAFATWVMAISITIHNKRNSDTLEKRLKLVEKESKKPVIIELVKNLYSLHEKIRENVKSLEKREFSWNHKSNKITMLKEIDTSFLSIYKSYLPADKTISLIRKKPYLDGLRKNLKELADTIYTEEFKEECERRIEEFLEENENTQLENKESLEISSTLLAYTIDSYDSLPNQNEYYEFWEENKKHFLRFREKDDVEKKIGKVEREVKNLLKSHEKTKDQLDELLSYYQEEFDIPLENFFWSRI